MVHGSWLKAHSPRLVAQGSIPLGDSASPSSGAHQASSRRHQASSVRHQASSIKHQSSSITHPTSSPKHHAPKHENEKNQSFRFPIFQVSEFQSFKMSKVLNVQSFEVPKLQSFGNLKASKSHFMFCRYRAHIQDLKYIKQIFRTFRDPYFPERPKLSNSKKRDFQKQDFSKMNRKYLMYDGVSRVMNNWFWESWTRPPSPKNIKMMNFGFWENES